MQLNFALKYTKRVDRKCVLYRYRESHNSILLVIDKKGKRAVYQKNANPPFIHQKNLVAK